LYHRTKILGQDVYQLVVPESRRAHVLKMGHNSFGGHNNRTFSNHYLLDFNGARENY